MDQNITDKEIRDPTFFWGEKMTSCFMKSGYEGLRKWKTVGQALEIYVCKCHDKCVGLS